MKTVSHIIKQFAQELMMQKGIKVESLVLNLEGFNQLAEEFESMSLFDANTGSKFRSKIVLITPAGYVEVKSEV